MKTYLCDNCGELVPSILKNRNGMKRELADVEICPRSPRNMKIGFEITADLCYQCVVPVFTQFFEQEAKELEEEYQEATISMKVKNMASIPTE